MREIVTSLLRLQELELVREETRIVHQGDAGNRLSDIEAAIRTIRDTIPEQDLRRFDGLRRNGVAAVREVHGVCRGCHLNVPVGDLNRMQRGEMPWLCPNCGRFLLVCGSTEPEGN
jgi:predicted  nucleic acid-binding Zn-ribbon protein